jgi:hypothetical protein
VKSRKRVEIARTGTFPLSTGKHTFTRAQFEAAVRNASGRTAAVLGIGHVDPRWKELSAGLDGEPALGRVEALEVEAHGDNAVLYGDLNDMPDWFADALPSAFPRRSIEGPIDGDDLTITAVKVLGTKLPGIQTLEDLKSFVSDEGPALIAAGADNDGTEITVLLASDGQIKASANLEDLRNAWQSEYPNSYEDEKPDDWWVLEEIQVDPDELICKHGGQIYRQPWTANADGSFTFGKQTEVVKQYVDKVAASAPAAVYIPPPDGGTKPDPQEVSTVDPKLIRQALGLPEDATDEQVAAKLAEQDGLKLQAVPAPETDPPKEEAPVDDTKPELPEGTVAIDPETLSELQVAASRADGLFEEKRVAKREEALDYAQGRGRFPKARRDHYLKSYEEDEDGTHKLLTASAAEGGLADGLVPVDKPRGTGVAASAGASSDALLAHTRRAVGIKPTPKTED